MYDYYYYYINKNCIIVIAIITAITKTKIVHMIKLKLLLF